VYVDGITINVLEMMVTHPNVDAFTTHSQKWRLLKQTSTIRIPTTQLAILDKEFWVVVGLVDLRSKHLRATNLEHPDITT
jgi:hypothetical protein